MSFVERWFSVPSRGVAQLPAAPTFDDPEIEAARRRERALAAKTRSPSANFLTGNPYGVTAPASIAAKVLTGE